MQATLADKQSVPIVVSGNFTAVNNATYIAIATLTVTDPTPSVGANYIVHIRNGTATIGGVAYAAGQDVHRVWHSGAWTSTPMPSRAASVTASRLTEFDSSGNLQNSAITDGVTGGVATLAATLTGNRTYTFPDQAGTVALLERAQTWTAAQTITTGSTTQLNITRAGESQQAITCTNTANGAALVVACGDGTTSGRFSYSSYGSLETSPQQWRVGLWGSKSFTIRDEQATENVFQIVSGAGGAATLLRPLTVPNGTAAAPGIRLTSEASGLYRVSATELGFAVAGTYAGGITSTGVLSARNSGTGEISLANSGTTTGTTIGAKDQRLLFRMETATVNAGGEVVWAATSDTGVERWAAITGAIASNSGSGATGSLSICTKSADATATLTARLTVNAAGDVSITNSTASTSTSSGALVVSGGVGVAGQATVRRIAYAVGTIATTGAIAALASDDGFTRLTGAAPDIQGIANPGTVAERIVLYCVNATTLRHENVTATAADRITSDTGADITVSAGKTVELIYDPTSSRWRPIRF